MGISGFFAGFQIAIFAFVGIELVGTAAAETRDPENLCQSYQRDPYPIIAFYVLSFNCHYGCSHLGEPYWPIKAHFCRDVCLDKPTRSGKHC